MACIKKIPFFFHIIHSLADCIQNNVVKGKRLNVKGKKLKRMFHLFLFTLFNLQFSTLNLKPSTFNIQLFFSPFSFHISQFTPCDSRVFCQRLTAIFLIGIRKSLLHSRLFRSSGLSRLFPSLRITTTNTFVNPLLIHPSTILSYSSIKLFPLPSQTLVCR